MTSNAVPAIFVVGTWALVLIVRMLNNSNLSYLLDDVTETAISLFLSMISKAGVIRGRFLLSSKNRVPCRNRTLGSVTYPAGQSMIERCEMRDDRTAPGL